MSSDLAPEALALDEAAWVHEAALAGIVSPTEIVRWADDWIMTLDTPPYWLIELSTLNSKRCEDYAEVMPPALTRRLKATECVSMVIGAFDRQRIDLEAALRMIFRIWLPISRVAPDDMPDPADHALFEQGPIPDLLAEWDTTLDQPMEESFPARCHAAFESHLIRHGASPDLALFAR